MEVLIKRPAPAVTEFRINWCKWLNFYNQNKQLLTSSFAITSGAGLVIDSSEIFNGRIAKFFVSAGTLDALYQLRNTITLTDNPTEEFYYDFQILVQEQT